jgi:predicted transcriptional regulator
MELSKKTTILFPPELFAQLTHLAEQRSTSVGELVREACRSQYFLSTREDRLAIVAQFEALRLPVANPRRMKQESLPSVKPLP